MRLCLDTHPLHSYGWKFFSADLHSSWALYECQRLLRSLGDLHFTDSGFPYWESGLGRVTMCQFRDNILVASSYPDCAHTKLIRNICQALGTAWNLSVLCECQSAKLPCEGSCHTSSVTAMGFYMVRGSDGIGLAYVHPNALSHTWDLKQGAPLKNPRAQHQGYVTAIITGALAGGAPWCTTWAGQLLSVSVKWLFFQGMNTNASPDGPTVQSNARMHARHTHPRKLQGISISTLNFSRDGDVVMSGPSSNGCRHMLSGRGRSITVGVCPNGFRRMG